MERTLDMNNGKNNRRSQASSSEVLSPMPKARDLVTAKMTVSAPHGSMLTGGGNKIEAMGKNTAWAKGSNADAGVSRYSTRKSYLEANHGGQEIPEAMLYRHVQSPASDVDKRGVSCAEGHSVIESHKRLAQAGQDFAAGQLDTFKSQLVPMPPTPKFGANATRAHKNKVWAKLLGPREEQLATILKETGAKSWEHYAQREASQLAWSDIKSHGKISDVRHADSSEVKPGNSMEYCVHCRKDIVNQMDKMKKIN
jgi:hypothetical protein